MGFHHFKVVPSNSGDPDRFLRNRAAKVAVNSVLPEPRPAATIHSFPKCGRTWLRTLLANYFNRHFSLHVQVDMQSLFTIIPNAHAGLKGCEHYQFGHISDMPLLLASHAVNTQCNEGDILLLRSIPDVVVSDYFQQQKLGAFDGDMDAFIDAEKGSLQRYCRYLNRRTEDGGWRRRYLLSYEGLHGDTAGELKRLLAHLNLYADDADVQAAVADSSFEKMRQAEKVAGHAGMPKTVGNPEMMKVRKGKVGGYADYLSEAQIERMKGIAQKLLSDEAKAMLAECRLSVAWSLDREVVEPSAW
nr:sulfotransferase domain-containing protein [Mariprofundus sp. KV]